MVFYGWPNKKSNLLKKLLKPLTLFKQRPQNRLRHCLSLTCREWVRQTTRVRKWGKAGSRLGLIQTSCQPATCEEAEEAADLAAAACRLCRTYPRPFTSGHYLQLTFTLFSKPFRCFCRLFKEVKWRLFRLFLVFFLIIELRTIIYLLRNVTSKLKPWPVKEAYLMGNTPSSFYNGHLNLQTSPVLYDLTQFGLVLSTICPLVSTIWLILSLQFPSISAPFAEFLLVSVRRNAGSAQNEKKDTTLKQKLIKAKDVVADAASCVSVSITKEV